MQPNSSLPSVTPDLQRKVLRGAVVIGSLTLGYFVGKRIFRKLRERKTSLLADKSPEVRQAMSLRSAMNPSGASWLMWGDGTKEDVIWQVAQQITDLDAVALAYRNLYSNELVKDLQSELGTNDFNAFLQAVASGQANWRVNDGRQPSQGAYAAPQKLIVAIQAVYVRTSPDASYHGRFYEVGENKNIHKTAQPGEFIGYATGKQHYDAKNGVRFIEVAYKKDGASKVLWVSASSKYTEQFSSKEALLQKYPQNSTALMTMLPLSMLGWMGLSGHRMITAVSTQVYDEDFKPTEVIPANMLVGYPVMALSGGLNEYTLIRTANGQDRWIGTESLTQQ
jgi:hypothetical protein